MRFYIKEIKLWFRNEQKPKSYLLEPNKINVITGTATKGKSSFLSIIDYCFLAPYSRLVETIINENISWYGIRFTIGDEEHLLARKSPINGVVSSEIYYSLNSKFTDFHPSPNIELERIKNKLNDAFGITEEILELGSLRKSERINLSFRSFLPYITLSESIITEEYSFYDVTRFTDSADVFESFPIALGLNTEFVKNSKRITFLEREIRKLEKNREKIEKDKETCKNKIEDLYKKAFEDGLIEKPENLDSMSLEEMIENLRETERYYYSLADNSKIIQEKELLDKKRLQIISQIRTCERSIKEYDAYVKTLDRISDSLQPIDYLLENSEELIQSIETIQFLDSLKDSLSIIKEQVNMPEKPGKDIYQKIEELNNQLSGVKKEIEEKAKIKNGFIPFSKVFMAVGKMLSDLTYIQKEIPKPFDKEGNLQELKSELERKSQLESLDILIDRLKVKLEMAIQSIYNKVSTMGKYNSYKVVFDMEKYLLQLKKPGNLFPEPAIGSQSNFMFIHLVFFLGLHKYAINENESLIPSFLFIDQPSKPYLNTSGSELNNSDREKLYEAFLLMNEFIKFEVEQNNRYFQIFMVEHTEPEFWTNNSDFDYFHTVDEFFGDKGLIPDYVLSN